MSDRSSRACLDVPCSEREFFIDNLLVRVHQCFWCTGLAPWEFESPFPGSLISTFLDVLSPSRFAFRVPDAAFRIQGSGLRGEGKG